MRKWVVQIIQMSSIFHVSFNCSFYRPHSGSEESNDLYSHACSDSRSLCSWSPYSNKRNSKAEKGRKAEKNSGWSQTNWGLHLHNPTHTHHLHLPAHFPLSLPRLIMITYRLGMWGLTRLRKKWKNVYDSSKEVMRTRDACAAGMGLPVSLLRSERQGKRGQRSEGAFRDSEKKEVTFWLYFPQTHDLENR